MPLPQAGMTTSPLVEEMKKERKMTLTFWGVSVGVRGAEGMMTPVSSLSLYTILSSKADQMCVLYACVCICVSVWYMHVCVFVCVWYIHVCVYVCEADVNV